MIKGKKSILENIIVPPDLFYEERVISNLRFEVDAEYLLQIYRDLTTLWWRSAPYKVLVEPNPNFPTRYNVNNINDTRDGFNFVSTRLGYLEVIPVTTDWTEVIDVKIVCSWLLEIKFWKDLEIILKDKCSVIHVSKSTKPQRGTLPQKGKAHKKGAKTNVNNGDARRALKYYATLRNWKEVLRIIHPWSDQSYNEISRKLTEGQKMGKYPSKLPSSPDTIKKIIEAHENGLLEE